MTFLISFIQIQKSFDLWPILMYLYFVITNTQNTKMFLKVAILIKLDKVL